jgi:RNA polymerase sigma factor (sigma-70 family)
MANVQLSQLVGYLRRLVRAPADIGLTDRHLLERFTSQRDETAFTELVQRHGAMVLSVCRRVLNDADAAEDAFQAAFLVLARKAGSLRWSESIGTWLYEVAYRTALKAKADASRRRAQERQAPTMPETEPLAELHWRELRGVLDEELTRLPRKYQAPVVLCYLEGKTNEEAAQQLGWTKGTVSGRLARARDILRERLARRGLALSAAVIGTTLPSKTVEAAVSPVLAESVARAASKFTAGSTLAASIPANILSLAEGVLQTMLISRIKWATTLVLAVALLGGTVGMLGRHVVWAEQPDKKADTPEKKELADPKSDVKIISVEPATPTIESLDNVNRIHVQFSEQQRFGLVCPKLRDPRNPDRPKMLTRDERGITNNTVVRIEGYEYLFGVEIPGVRWVKENGKVMKEAPVPGKPRNYVAPKLPAPATAQQIDGWIADLDSNSFAVRSKATEELRKHIRQAAPKLREALKGNPALEVRQRLESLLVEFDKVPVKDFAWQSIWESDFARIRVTQSVEIVLGEQTRLYDTALVKYHIVNRDRTPHTVGLRVMLDTFVGATDGVPFYVPPTSLATTAPARGAGFVEKMNVFTKPDIPDFVQALESADFKDANNTLALVGLKMKGAEPLEKFVICRWPQNSEARWGGGAGPGEWIFEPMDKNPNAKDSCVLLYWAQANMKPNEERTLAFTYGLGKMGSDLAEDVQRNDKMRLLVGNRAAVDKSFVVTAYVKPSDSNQKVTLKLPKALKLAGDQQAEQPVPPVNRDGYAQVTWQVKADEPGTYIMEVTGANLGIASERVIVHKTSMFE